MKSSQNKPSIKVIAFDLGDVLVIDDAKRLEKRYNYEHMSKRQQKEYVTAFHLAEVGRLTPDKLFRVIQKTLVPQLGLQAIRNEMLSVPLIGENWRLALRLKRNYKIIILSNSERNWPKAIAARLNINLKQFPIVNSAYIGLRKPHPNYFRYVFRKFKVKPEQMVFIDDRPANIKTANQLGMHGFVYKNKHKELIIFLRKLGIKGLGKVR